MQTKKNAVTSSWERFIPTISGIFEEDGLLLGISHAAQHSIIMTRRSRESLLSASSSVLARFPP